MLAYAGLVQILTGHVEIFAGHVHFQNHVPDGHVNQMLNVKPCYVLYTNTLYKLIILPIDRHFIMVRYLCAHMGVCIDDFKQLVNHACVILATMYP